MFESSQYRRLAAATVACGALTVSACATPRQTRDVEYGLGACALGVGVGGGALLATSVYYDPRARKDDGSFIAVADQEGVSLLPLGIGVGVLGLIAGGMLSGSAAGIDVPVESARESTTDDASTDDLLFDGPASSSVPERKPATPR